MTQRVDLDASIAAAVRHAEHAKKAVLQQRAMVAKLRKEGHDTKVAKELLDQFEKLSSELASHVDTLTRMQHQDAAAERNNSLVS